jgi:hypothetical protein
LHWTTQARNETAYEKKERKKGRKKERKEERKKKNERKEIINAMASVSTHMNSIGQ